MEQELLNDSTMSAFLATSAGAITVVLVMLWSLVWKGIALWKAARRGETAWYVVLLVLNTVGILEIIYIFLVAKDTKKSK